MWFRSRDQAVSSLFINQSKYFESVSRIYFDNVNGIRVGFSIYVVQENVHLSVFKQKLYYRVLCVSINNIILYKIDRRYAI